METNKPRNFQEHLLSEYKKRATFEAEEMHDWNSAKLYSEKALKSLETDEIYPEEISYWKLPEENINEIKIPNENHMTIYKDEKTAESTLADRKKMLEDFPDTFKDIWHMQGAVSLNFVNKKLKLGLNNS